MAILGRGNRSVPLCLFVLVLVHVLENVAKCLVINGRAGARNHFGDVGMKNKIVCLALNGNVQRRIRDWRGV
jgi:hypothetical protein